MTKKNKTTKTNAIRLIDQQNIPYDLFTYPWKEDELEVDMPGENSERPIERIFKTLVTVGDKTGPMVAVIPVTKALDLKQFAAVSGNKRVDMLPMRDLEKTTGYLRGGCSPIGMKKHYPTYVAKEALAFERILVSGGRRGLQIELAVSDLLQITAGILAEMTTH